MTGPRVTMEKYIRDGRTTTPDGTVIRESSENVTAQHVRQYLEARSFFEAGGWVETQRKTASGGILIVTTEPDGTEHMRLFTPLREAVSHGR